MGLIPLFLARAAVQNTTRRKNKILIAIFQRGAADGLNFCHSPATVGTTLAGRSDALAEHGWPDLAREHTTRTEVCL